MLKTPDLKKKWCRNIFIDCIFFAEHLDWLLQLEMLCRIWWTFVSLTVSKHCFSFDTHDTLLHLIMFLRVVSEAVLWVFGFETIYLEIVWKWLELYILFRQNFSNNRRIVFIYQIIAAFHHLSFMYAAINCNWHFSTFIIQLLMVQIFWKSFSMAEIRYKFVYCWFAEILPCSAGDHLLRELRPLARSLTRCFNITMQRNL